MAQFPGQRPPFQRGNLAAVVHGAASARLTGPRAGEIAQAFMSSSVCPADVREDPVLMDAILAWAQAAAECERLRAYRDLLDEQLGAESIDAYLTETTELSETVVRPAMGAEKRESLARQRESLGHALHRAEMRLRAMRNDLWKRLEASPRGQAIDYAAYWAQRAREREASGGS